MWQNFQVISLVIQATKSEIVLPLRDEKGQIYGCLDIDSDQLGAFDEEDEQGLLKILQLVDKEK